LSHSRRQARLQLIAALSAFDRLRYFSDFALSGFPTKYCIDGIPAGMPWIYPPYQTYGYILLIVSCGYFSCG
jgi:hypothetical protein